MKTVPQPRVTFSHPQVTVNYGARGPRGKGGPCCESVLLLQSSLWTPEYLSWPEKATQALVAVAQLDGPHAMDQGSGLISGQSTSLGCPFSPQGLCVWHVQRL